MTAPDNGLELLGIGKRYGEVAALAGVDLAAEAGEIISITGPSGAGKSTVCRLVSGVERPSSGRIRLGGRDITRLPPQRRNVAYMFESYALYPHMTVFENIASPLRSPRHKGRFDEAAIGERVAEVAALTEMAGLVGRLPAALSGGQKQRVALCRALVQEPDVYLLDEPIAHLDAKLRHGLRGAIRRRLIRRGAPTLWCTPDAMEALSVGDRVVVVMDGAIQQTGTADAVYRRPANTRVARLIGDPAMNLLSGRLEDRAGTLVFRHPAGRIALGEVMVARLRARARAPECVLGVRPTDIMIGTGERAGAMPAGEVYTVEPFGKYSIVTVRLGSETIKIKTSEPIELDSGSPVWLTVQAVDHVVFDAQTGRSI